MPRRNRTKSHRHFDYTRLIDELRQLQLRRFERERARTDLGLSANPWTHHFVRRNPHVY